MKIVIPGGSGDVGTLLQRFFVDQGHQVVILSRSVPLDQADDADIRVVAWDGKTLGPWADEVDGADVVINLAGRSVDCRPTEENRREILNSRIDSTTVVGEAISAAKNPPKAWIQMSTATIYSHRFDAPNDEATGIIGGDEPDVPERWQFSVELAKKWEKAQQEAATPSTRKVILRTSLVMSPTESSVFGVLLRMTKLRLSGAIAGGDQYVSWIHERDFARAVQFLIDHPIEGPVIMAAPEPLPQREHMAILRDEAGVSIGLPAAGWMAKIGAVFLRTDPELILKSRRVVPGRLLEEGFSFEFPTWREAARDLIDRYGR